MIKVILTIVVLLAFAQSYQLQFSIKKTYPASTHTVHLGLLSIDIDPEYK